MPARNLSRRNVVLAGVLAALAALLTLAYVSRAHTTTAAAATVGPLQTVYFAARDISTGTAGSSALAGGDLVARRVPRDQVVPDAVTSAAQVSHLVAVQPIFAGEQATTRRFGSNAFQGIRSQLRGTLRVLEVPGTREQLLAGTLQPGDHVDVVASLKRGQTQTAYGGIVLRDLLVLQVPSSGKSVLGGSNGDDATAVVQLTDAQAQKLFFVMQNGSWAFALRPPAHAADSATTLQSAATVLGGGQ